MRMEILAYCLFKLDGFEGKLSNGVDHYISTGTFMQNVIALRDGGYLFVDSDIISLHRNLVRLYNRLTSADKAYLDYCLNKGLYRFTNSNIKLTVAEEHADISLELFRYLRSTIIN
jgi:hypothetical protein